MAEELGFKVYERLGTPIYDLAEYRLDHNCEPLDSQEDIERCVHEGRMVFTEMWMLSVGAITKFGDGWAIENKCNYGLVQWSEQDLCWICTTVINKKCLDVFSKI